LLLDRISVGGMAEVFKAKSYGVEGFEKIIAIKRILPTMGEDRDFIKMFIDEAKIAGQLAHANICQIFELGRIDGSHFIAMEYIWGKDLLQIQNRLRKVKQQMPVPMACFTIAKVLEGLDYAHRKRDPLGRPLEIVHRDCSPQNVLVSYEGEVKVIDFGIAKATSRNSRTMAGVLKGKFGYMSPEQVRGLPLDRRSDIFALGTMLYECLTGERLFQGETDFSTLEKVRNVDIQTPRSINPNIPEAVEKVILKALAKDVDDRYQWCSEMLTDLQAYLMSQDVVFTAKSLSGWLKDVFQQEIERERQQLETYKRVGRDGLIGGLPSAEANKDVVGQLGPAGEVEGDATTLGGPSFDDIEQALQANASPESAQEPARRGGDDDDGDFGEEAPTEIFGELDSSKPPAPTPAAGRPPTTSPPSTKPPKPPPGRPSTQRPQEVPVAASMAAGASGQHPAMRQTPPGSMPMQQPGQQPQQMMYAAASPAAGMPAQGYPQHPSQQNYYPQQPGALGTDPGQMGQMAPMGTPGSMQAQYPGLAPPGGQQGKTVLGMQAPVGVPNYGNNYRPSAPQQAQYPYPQNYPSGPMQQMMPQGYPSGPMQQMPPGYGYPGSGPMSATPIDGQHEGRRSTLVRDILIGVAIAALVLGGFFIIKLFVLDKDEGPAATTSTIATVQLSITAGIAADMIVDNMRVGAVMDKQEIPLGPGKRHIVIAGPNGMKCDQTVTLEAGKTTTLKCDLSNGAGSAAAGSNAGSAAAPAAGSGAGSAAAGSNAGSGSAAAAVIDTKPDTKDTKAPDTKVSDTKPATKDTKDTKVPDTKVSDTKPDTKPVDKTVAHATSIAASHTTTPTVVATKDIKPESHDTHADKKPDTKLPVVPEPDKPDTKPDAKDVSGKGYLQVFSKPAAKILVDGIDTGMSTPISGHSLPLGPGKHKVTFVMGDDRYTFPVTIKVGATETMSKDLQ
jgi:serine/threonine protein kinase